MYTGPLPLVGTMKKITESGMATNSAPNDFLTAYDAAQLTKCHKAELFLHMGDTHECRCVQKKENL